MIAGGKRGRLVLPVAAMLMVGTAAPVMAQDADPQATISAFETRVAELEAQLTPEPGGTRAKPALLDEPIDLGQGLQLDYYYLVDDGYGNVQLLGELSSSEAAVAFPHLQFVAYDTAGNLIDTISVGSPLPAIYPGETVPIEGFIGDVSVAEIAEEVPSLCDTSQQPGEYGPEGLSFQNVTEDDRAEDSFTVSGQILNESDVDKDGVRVYALVYLPDGRYAGHGSTVIQAPIPAGKSARFEISGYGIYGLQANPSSDYTYELTAVTFPWATVSFC